MPDLGTTLKSAAPIAARPLDIDALVKVARRRTRTRRLMSVAVVVLAVALAVPLLRTATTQSNVVGHVKPHPQIERTPRPSAYQPGGMHKQGALARAGGGVSAVSPRTTARPTSAPQEHAAVGMSGHIAYVRDGAIYVRDVASGTTRELVASGFDPAWSPDASLLAYTTDEGNFNGLFIVHADGSGRREIFSRSASRVFSPAWSSDGKRLAFTFTSDPTGSVNQLWIISADGTGAHRVSLPTSETPYNCTWSPDGRRIAYTTPNQVTSNAEIHSVDLVSGAVVKIGDGFDPSWAPDGKTIVAVQNLSIVLLYVGGGTDPLTGPYDGADPTWSPDGRSIAFTKSSCGCNMPMSNATGTLVLFDLASRTAHESIDGVADPAWTR